MARGTVQRGQALCRDSVAAVRPYRAIFRRGPRFSGGL